MKRDYTVTIRHYTKGSISACDVANIIKEERHNLLGGSDRYIDSDGMIKEEDYRSNSVDVIRKATDEEIKYYEALYEAEEYFNKLHYSEEK
ncbi:hypothetical protein INTERNEXUS_56 [Bacillus phage vB_BspM_Internexus]|nr:hypothetical protein INTERNEXUS_56 [Bacillus phage vB_BspM_Internexus]